MQHWGLDGRKKWVAIAFIVLYLVPLTWMYVEQVLYRALVKGLWAELLAFGLVFGLPLGALWVAVFEYPSFKKGTPPFRYGKVEQSVMLLSLALGAAVCAVFVVYPVLFLLKVAPFPYEPLGLGVALIVGILGTPASLFAVGVLLKHRREATRNAA